MLLYTCTGCGATIQGVLVGNTWGPSDHKCKNKTMENANFMQTGPFYESYPQDTVKCEEVIICFNKRIGKGTEDDPVRIVLQVFTKDGKIIAERDAVNEFRIVTTANK